MMARETHVPRHHIISRPNNEENDDPYPEVPEAGADAWRAISKIFPWGNGAPVTDRVLGDLLKEEVRAAPLFVPLYNYYREYGADQVPYDGHPYNGHLAPL